MLGLENLDLMFERQRGIVQILPHHSPTIPPPSPKEPKTLQRGLPKSLTSAAGPSILALATVILVVALANIGQ